MKGGAEISTETWIKILQDEKTTSPAIREIFEALYARPHHRASASELGAELGYPRGSPKHKKSARSPKKTRGLS